MKKYIYTSSEIKNLINQAIKEWNKLNVNEKFTENNSDPIHDMGIGLSFTRVKPHDIVIIKKDIFKNYENDNLIFDKNIKAYGGLYKPGMCAVVKSVNKYIKNTLEIEMIFFDSFETASSGVNINNKNFILTRGTASLEKWEEYFEVVPYEKFS